MNFLEITLNMIHPFLKILPAPGNHKFQINFIYPYMYAMTGKTNCKMPGRRFVFSVMA
jgi:hypothetical protein